MKYVMVNLDKPDSWENNFILKNLTMGEVYKIDTLNIKGKAVAVVYYCPKPERYKHDDVDIYR